MCEYSFERPGKSTPPLEHAGQLEMTTLPGYAMYTVLAVKTRHDGSSSIMVRIEASGSRRDTVFFFWSGDTQQGYAANLVLSEASQAAEHAES